MQQSSVDLASIFQSVTQALAENQQTLNQADEYNRNHGDNMVQTFQTITRALEQKKGASDSAALSYAAKQLSKTTTSSSGQLYAQNLTQAAGQFKGKKVDAQGALQLLQTLIGAAQSQPAAQSGGDSADVLGSLLGGLAGGGTPQSQAPAHNISGEDVLSSILGGLAGGGTQPHSTAGGAGGHTAGGLSDGLGMDDLLNAGMAYMQAKQAGGTNTNALLQALLAGSGMGNSIHRNESTAVVVNAFLQALSSLNKRR